MLWLYHLIAAYGESYPRVALWLLALVVIFPAVALVFLVDCVPNSCPRLLTTPGYSFGYYLYAIVPGSIGNAFTQTTQQQLDTGSLQWLLHGLGVEKLSWLGEFFMRGSVVVFYLLFFILLALLVMSVRRRYKR